MGPKTVELIQVLQAVERLLDEQHETRWRNWISMSRRRLINSDFAGIEKLLSAYGGMGSFNDLVVGYYERDGTVCQRNGGEQANQTLNTLRDRAWELATAIKHEFQQSAQ
jgi:hypothetical protein